LTIFELNDTKLYKKSIEEAEVLFNCPTPIIFPYRYQHT